MKFVFAVLMVTGVAFAGSEEKIQGGLESNVIDQHIKGKIKEIRKCYETELENSRKNFSGKVSVKFEINREGKVQSAAIEESTLMNSKVEECVVKEIRLIPFPKPEGGGKVSVTYPFSFSPVK